MDSGGVPDMAERLLELLGQVSADEFYRHDTHYNRDSRLGRELLYLIANDDWIRSTTEVINLNRSDAIDSVIKLNVDTGKITHEAFGDQAGPLWLPLLVLTMPDRVGSVQPASPGQLTVVDQNGSVLAPMREADVWHAISAALAEIFVTIADTRWPWPEERRPGADRDQRVLLSAAMFRMLSGTGRTGGWVRADKDIRPDKDTRNRGDGRQPRPARRDPPARSARRAKGDRQRRGIPRLRRGVLRQRRRDSRRRRPHRRITAVSRA